MRKLIFIILGLCPGFLSLATPVTLSEARLIADNYFSHYSGKPILTPAAGFSVQYRGTTVYHVLNYLGGGFVVVAADDAVIPVLAESSESFIEQNISNPSTKYWFECYSKEIEDIIKAGADNSITLQQWNRIRNNEFDRATSDVGPLLTTSWDQGQWYNAFCPSDAAGPGGHVWAGCVAAAMGQIMKYYNFPSQGVMSHSYESVIYGTQSANFADSVYNWDRMGNSASSSAYMDIASLLYQVGVSVDMNYNMTGSGAYDAKIPWALSTYFNYDPSDMGMELKSDYTETEWKELIKAELNALHPVFYSGDDLTLGGHAWVCDGWNWGSDMFHMNWGWSGLSDGWYFIGSLNTFNGRYNTNHAIVKGIKPGNPDLVIRITNLHPGQLIAYGQEVGIDCSVIRGAAGTIHLYVDNNLVYTTTQTGFTYGFKTTDYALGSHTIKVEAINATDTAYHEVTIRNSYWVSQASAFPVVSRGVGYLHVVDSLVAWGTAYDGANTSNCIQEFTRTSNGGQTWIPGTIPACAGLVPSMIFALNADTAYCPMYKLTGSNPQGIYVSFDGGIGWSRQQSASFSNSASFPNVVHFFNRNEGFCMGDPANGEFEIYTSMDGGNNWIPVAADSIPDPIPDEYGVTGYYSAKGEYAWFGTSKGRVYRTRDKGHNWEVSTTTLGGKFVDVEFADSLHGLAQDRNQ
ncbi:MAG: C10 family peptidase, partial [Bacteroidota bacterium]